MAWRITIQMYNAFTTSQSIFTLICTANACDYLGKQFMMSNQSNER